MGSIATVPSIPDTNPAQIITVQQARKNYMLPQTIIVENLTFDEQCKRTGLLALYSTIGDINTLNMLGKEFPNQIIDKLWAEHKEQLEYLVDYFDLIEEKTPENDIAFHQPPNQI